MAFNPFSSPAPVPPKKPKPPSLIPNGGRADASMRDPQTASPGWGAATPYPAATYMDDLGRAQAQRANDAAWEDSQRSPLVPKSPLPPVASAYVDTGIDEWSKQMPLSPFSSIPGMGAVLSGLAASGWRPGRNAAEAAAGVAATPPGSLVPQRGAARPGSSPAPARPNTFKGAKTGTVYNVGQTYRGDNGYTYTAQQDGTFKQTGKPAGGGAKAYNDRASSNNQGAGGYTSSGQSRTNSDGTSWASSWGGG